MNPEVLLLKKIQTCSFLCTTLLHYSFYELRMLAVRRNKNVLHAKKKGGMPNYNICIQ